jgi:hypothetical protein
MLFISNRIEGTGTLKEILFTFMTNFVSSATRFVVVKNGSSTALLVCAITWRIIEENRNVQSQYIMFIAFVLEYDILYVNWYEHTYKLFKKYCS